MSGADFESLNRKVDQLGHDVRRMDDRLHGVEKEQAVSEKQVEHQNRMLTEIRSGNTKLFFMVVGLIAAGIAKFIMDGGLANVQ